MLEQYLEEIGLSEKESKIYLAALELGEASVSEIADLGAINRSTAYVILESLQKKGLVSCIEKNKKQVFYAESPERLKVYIESKIKDFQLKKEGLGTVLNEFAVIENRRKDKPVVRFYEGNDGVNALLEEFLTKTEKVEDPQNEANKLYVAYSRDMQEKTVPKEDRDRRRTIRDKSGVQNVYIYTKEEGEMAENPNRTNFKIDGGEYPLPAQIAVFKNKIRLLSYTKRSGILVVDSELAETLRTLMRLAVKGAKK